MISPKKIVFRTGATAAGLGAFVLEQTADRLRGWAADGDDKVPEKEGTDVPIQHRDRPREVETTSAPSTADSAPAGTGKAAEGAGTAGSGRGAAAVKAAAKAPTQKARKEQPLVAADKTPANAAAPAGGDPDGSSGTGPVPRRISSPKAARKVRQREAKAGSVTRLEVKGGAKRGGRPGSIDKAENTPSERAKSGAGREPAPMGSSDGGGDSA